MEDLLNEVTIHEQKALLACLTKYDQTQNIPHGDLWMIAIHLYHHMKDYGCEPVGYHDINARCGNGEDPAIHEFMLMYNRTPARFDVINRIWAARRELMKYERFSEPRRLREIVNTAKDEPAQKPTKSSKPTLTEKCPICGHAGWCALGGIYYCESCSYTKCY